MVIANQYVAFGITCLDKINSALEFGQFWKFGIQSVADFNQYHSETSDYPQNSPRFPSFYYD